MAATDPELKSLRKDLPDPWGKWCRAVIRPSGIVGSPPCPRRYLYSQRFRWLPAKTHADALRVGGIFHRLLAGVHAGRPFGEVVDLLANAVGMAVQEMEDPKEQAAANKVFQVARVMAQLWMAEFADRLQDVKTLVVEQTIQEPLAHVRIATSLIGTIDAVVQDDQGIWIVDHKTCSETPAIRASGLTYDSQARAYRELWDTSHADMKCVGCIHNLVMKPTIRVKKTETYDEYLTRVGEWYETQMLDDKNANTVPMARSFVKFHEPPMDQNPEFLCQLVQEGLWATMDPSLSVFYRNRHACVQFKKVCPYADLCNRNIRMWPGLLAESGRFKKGEDSLTDALQSRSSITDGVADDLAD